MDRRENGQMENIENIENIENTGNMAEAPQMEQPQPERVMRREQNGGVESITQTIRAIDAIEHKLMDAPKVLFYKNTVKVELDEIVDLLGQLRMVLPKSVVQAQSVLSQSQQIIAAANEQADKTADEADRIYNDTVTKARQFKDEVEGEADAYDKAIRQKAQEDAAAMVADAQNTADQIIFAAQQQAQKMVDENEITRRAQAYAMETRERAEKDADSIYNQACIHTDKMLSGAAAALSRSAGELAALRDNLLSQTPGM